MYVHRTYSEPPCWQGFAICTYIEHVLSHHVGRDSLLRPVEDEVSRCEGWEGGGGAVGAVDLISFGQVCGGVGMCVRVHVHVHGHEHGRGLVRVRVQSESLWVYIYIHLYNIHIWIYIHVYIQHICV